jgi:hypothetical protein
MPFMAVATILLQVTCVVHVIRSGRSPMWLTVIVFLPLVGCLAYFIAEVLPDMRHSRAARRLSAEASRVIAPDREYNLLREAAQDLPTAENKRLLAEELMRRGSFTEAQTLYESSLTPPHDTDPVLLMGLARAQYLQGNAAGTIATLDRLQQLNPGYQSHPGHLLYAQALEAAGRTDEALSEYAALVTVFPGEEARCRYALLLHLKGEIARAREMFGAVIRSVEKGGRHYRSEQKEWYELARQNLGS